MKIVFFLLFISIAARTQTRLYFNYKVASAVTTPTNPVWFKTTSIVIHQANYVDGSTTASRNVANDSSKFARPVYYQIFQINTPPLISQVYTGNIHIQIRMSASNATVFGGNGIIFLRLVNPNGTVVEIDSALTPPAMLTTTNTNTHADFNETGLVIQGGQRLGFDFGVKSTKCTTNGTSPYRIAVQSSATSGDLPLDDTTTAALNPFIQFSQTLKFQRSASIF